MVNQEPQISAIPPERYGDRFVRFISGITKTREAAEKEKADAENTIDDSRLSGVNTYQRDPTEIVIENAERQAERSKQRGASEDDVPNREIRTIRSLSVERGELGSTLPVVEEAVESASTGGRSGKSSPQPSAPLEEKDLPPLQLQEHKQMPQRPPPTPPKEANNEHDDRPPTPPKDNYEGGRQRGPPTPPKDELERGRGRDKELPLPPPIEKVLRVN